MLVQQPQSKSKIVTVQAAGKLQEISCNQQENQHFSARNRHRKTHQVFGHHFLRWPWQDHYLGRPSTKQINRSYDLDGFGSRMVSIRVLCNPGACSLHVCKCLMYLTVHSCVKGSKGFRCITSLLWVLWIIMSILVWVVVLVPVKRFRTNDFIPLRTDVVGKSSIRCNRLSLESRAGFMVEVTVNWSVGSGHVY